MSKDTIYRQDAIDIASGYCHPANIADELRKLPSAQPMRWIPCSERLPKERGFYLVSVGAPYKTVRVYEYEPCEGYENENLWKNYDGSYCFNWFVEAWMPLPKTYGGEQE